tara:strand:+ start:2647 stop:3060 length:414 start_codon:yes stop_codon:yes gene_type:complete
MTGYALVENGVVSKVGGLPKSWRNVSGLHLASDAELKEKGWLPFTETVVEISKYEVKNGTNYVISADGVVGAEQKRDMTDDEKTAKDADDAVAYKWLRKMKYDQLNQYELMYDDKVNSTDKWGEAIEAIKKAHPKPE